MAWRLHKYQHSFTVVCITNAQINFAEIPVCNPNPCQHGGKCIETSDTEFECNCTGILYHGRTCEFGLVQIIVPGTVTLRVPFIVVVNARPVSLLKIDFSSSHNNAALLADPSSSVELNGTTNTAHATFLPLFPGIQYLGVSLSGTDATIFTPVSRIPVLVKTTATSLYFSTFGNDSLIKASCIESSPKLLCRDTSEITFFSSCNWKDNSTHGIVFSSYNNYVQLPVSVAGLYIDFTQINVQIPEYNVNQGCTGDEPTLSDLNPKEKQQEHVCYKHHSNNADLESFVMKQSLSNTFLSVVVEKLLPASRWTYFVVPDDANALANLANSDYIVSITNREGVPLHANCESVHIDTIGYFSVLHHNGPLLLLLKTASSEQFREISLPSPPIGSFFCVAVNLCLGDDSPVYIGLPPSVQSSLPADINFISNYISRGWSFQFLSVRINKRSPSHQVTSENYWNGSFANYHPIIPASDIELNVRIAGSLIYDTSTLYLQMNGQLLYNYEGSLEGVGIYFGLSKFIIIIVDRNYSN